MGPRITVHWNTSRPDSSDTVRPIRATEAAITDGKKPEHAAEETTRYQTLEGALACLIEDFSLSGIRANPDQPSLFHGHQS